VDPVRDPLLLRKSGSAENRALTTVPQRRSPYTVGSEKVSGMMVLHCNGRV
jgi:hypothetical protein